MKHYKKLLIWIFLGVIFWLCFPAPKTRHNADYSIGDRHMDSVILSTGIIEMAMVEKWLELATVHRSPLSRTENLQMDAKLVIGIECESDNSSVVVETVKSLLRHGQKSTSRFLIVVQFYSSGTERFRNPAWMFERAMRRHVSDGNVIIIETSPRVNDELIISTEQLDYEAFRRTKQGFQFAHLMLFSSKFAKHVLYLSENMSSQNNFVDKMEEFINEIDSQGWISLHFGGFGWYGSLFKFFDIYPISQAILSRCHKQSVTETLNDIINQVYPPCHNKIGHNCVQELGMAVIKHKPSLFIAKTPCEYTKSSVLHGKATHCRDPNRPLTNEPRPWEDVPIYVNPAATLHTTMRPIKPHTLDGAYNLQDYLLVEAPTAGDTIVINFTTPVAIEEYFLRSWHSGHPKARFDTNTYIDVCPLYVHKVDLSNTYYFKYKIQPDGYITVGRFDDRGIAQGPLGEDRFGKIRSVPNTSE